MQLLFGLSSNLATNSPCFLHTASFHVPLNSITKECPTSTAVCVTSHPDSAYKTLSVGQLDLQKLLRQTFRFNTIVLHTDSVFCLKKSLFYVIVAFLKKKVGVNKRCVNKKGVRILKLSILCIFSPTNYVFNTSRSGQHNRRHLAKGR
jgi:hypothetical protein